MYSYECCGHVQATRPETIRSVTRTFTCIPPYKHKLLPLHAPSHHTASLGDVTSRTSETHPFLIEPAISDMSEKRLDFIS
jgi:hypothetical protein